MIYVKKSFNLNKTQTVSSQRKVEMTESFNLTLKLNTLADDIGMNRAQKSPEFPKDSSERVFSNTRSNRMEASNPDLHEKDLR